MLCFFVAKFGKCYLKSLKTLSLEYFTSQDIQIAKNMLLEDILKLVSIDKPPHAP